MLQKTIYICLLLLASIIGLSQTATISGVVKDADGEPVLDYPFSAYLWQGVQQAYLAMAELQFAAGATAVMPVHQSARLYHNMAQAKAAILQLPLAPYQVALASAHVMGGCNMAATAELGVVDRQGRHFQLENLSVFDGSVLPSSLGANPQLTIFALVWRNASLLAAAMGGKTVGSE